jgi:hypothetical protein
MHERGPPVRGVDDVGDACRGPAEVEVDERCRQAVAEDDVARVVVLVRDELRFVEQRDDACWRPGNATPYGIDGWSEVGAS